MPCPLPPSSTIIVILCSMTSGAQQALRRTMEIYSNTTRFALACNQSTKIIEPIQSRCAIVRYTRISDPDILHRLLFVAEKEGVSLMGARMATGSMGLARRAGGAGGGYQGGGGKGPWCGWGQQAGDWQRIPGVPAASRRQETPGKLRTAPSHKPPPPARGDRHRACVHVRVRAT